MKKNGRAGIRSIHTHKAGAHALSDEFRRKRRVSAGWVPNRSPIAHIVALALGAGLAAPAAAQVVANGRTATTVTTNGAVTDVHTATTRGANAFNAFSQFVVNGGHIANLHLPGSTQNLVNLVDSQVQINGTLNSLYSSGKIGGNVFFASPQGFIVGAGGVVNVGKLVVSTPTAGFIDDLIDDGFQSADVDALMNGTAPSAGGLITIEGQVNALDGVKLHGGSVDISGAVHAGAAALSAIESQVALNLAGMPTAIGAERDGDIIRLVGDGDAPGSTSSGEILITATKVVDLDAGLTDANAVIGISGAVIGDGDVTIKAKATDKRGSGQATANASVRISGTIEAQDISATADATAESEYTNDLTDMVLTSGVGALAGITLSTVAADANASVLVDSGAVLDASENITLHADAKRVAATPAINITARKVGATAVLADLSGTTEVRIASGVNVEADGNLDVKATSVNEIDVSAITVTNASDTYFAGTLAYSQADVTTAADIASGATVKAGNIGIRARNENSFSTTATAMANGAGKAGAAAAITDIDVHTSATLGANLAGANGTGDLVILAENYTEENKASASATAGSGAVMRILGSAAGGVGSFIQNKAGGASDKAGGKVDGNAQNPGSDLKLAAAVAVSEVDLDAHAGIANNVQIDATGDVAVLAKLEDAGIRSDAKTEINAQINKGGSDGNIAVAAAIAVGQFNHTAEATIGENVRIDAERIGVGAEAVMPITITWNKGEGLDAILPKLNTNLGLLNQVLTSYASANGDSGELGLFGATNYFESQNNVRAWAGKGSTLTATGNRDDWNTSYVDREGNAKSWTWQETVDLQARSVTESIDIAGNINFINPISGTTSGEGGVSVGAAFNWIEHGANTIAGIGDDVTVTTTGLSVNASTDDRMIVVSPTSGSGGGFGGNGIVALSLIDNVTHASISNEATITADAVTLDAAQGLSVWSAAGSLSREESAAVGMAIAVNDVTTDTKAYIGDNDADSPSGDETDGAKGTITTDSLSANAITDGMVGTFAVAGAVASSDDPAAQPGMVARAKGKVSSKVGGLRNKAADMMTNLPVLGALADKVRTKEGASASNEQPSKPPFGIAVSGASSVNISAMETSAFVDGATINSRSAGQTDVLARAVTNTDLISGAGGAALAAAKNPSAKFSAGVAGAVAYNQLDNDTYAGIRNTSINDAGDVKVQALSAGDQISVGLGIALNTSQDQSKAGVAAGSVSLTQTDNSTKAEIAGSTIKGDGSDTDTVEVTAYDRARIANGGGTFTYGGKVGVGAAVSFAQITNSAEAIIDGGQLSDLDSIGVSALSASRIVNAAAMGGGGADANSIQGAFVFSEVAKDVRAVVRNGAQLTTDGDVSVVAAGTSRDSNLDALLTADRDNDVDFSLERGDAETPVADQIVGDGRIGEDRGGEAIIGVAGQLAIGKNNVGLSFAGQTIHNTYEAVIESATVNAGGDVTVAAQDSAQIIGVAAGVGGATGKFSGIGSATANVVVTSVDARIGAEDAAAPDTLVTGANIDVTAKNAAEIYAGAGNIAASKNVAAGAAVAYNQTTNSTKARVNDATLNAGTGKVTLDALSESAIRGLAASGVGAQSGAVGGSLNFNLITDTVQASVRDTDVTAGSLSVKARDRDEDSGSRSSIWSLAGNVSGAGKVAVGGAVSINTVANTIDAIVDGSTLTIGGNTSVDAESGSEIYAIAVAGGGAGTVAANGSVAVNTLANTTTATVGNSSVTAANLNATASERDDAAGQRSRIWSLAGAVSGAGTAAIGAASAVNTVANNLDVLIENSTIDVGAGTVQAATNAGAEIKSAAAAGGGAGTAAVTGAVTVNTIASESTAKAIDATITAGKLIVKAHDLKSNGNAGSLIQSLAGNVNGAGTASIGLASAVNTIANRVEAGIDGSTLTIAGATTVEAKEKATIQTLAADGGGAGTAAVGGSATVNNIANTTRAGISNTSNVGTGNDTHIIASDTSNVDSIAGAIRVGGQAGLGFAASVNRIGNTVETYLSGNKSADAYEAKNVVLDAASDATIRTIALGVGFGGAAGVAGSVATNMLDTTVTSRIDGGALVQAENNVGVLAANSDKIEVVAGAAGIGAMNAGVGLSTVVNVIESQTVAKIADASTRVNALGKDASDTLTVKTGALNAAPDIGETPDADSFDWYDLKGKTRQASGVAVNAFSTQQVGSVSAAAGITAPNPKGSAAVGATTGVNVLSGVTEAYVDGAQINKNNTGAGTGQDVEILAASHSYSTSFVAGAAVSGDVAMGGALDTTVISRATRAYARNADITAADDIVLSAQSAQGARAIGASIGGAIVGGAGTGMVGIISGTTEAYLDNTTVRSIDLDVNAASRSGINLMGGSLSLGAASIGGAFALGVSDQTTRAYIHDGAAYVSGNVGVTADAGTNFWNLAVAGAAGGMAVSGMAAVNVVSNTTEAYVDGANIGTSGAKVHAATVSAEDDVTVRSYGGAAGLAAGSSAGAAANVTVVQSRVAAEVKNSDVYATNALDVKALSSVDAEHVTVAVGAAAGAAGVAGSASLILLGNGTSGEAMGELNKGGDGILGKVFDLSGGDKVSETDNLNTDQLDTLNNSDAQESKGDLANLDAERGARLGNTELSLSGGELTDVNDSGKYDTAKHFDAGADADVTRAAITGGVIDVGSVSVTAEDQSRKSNVAGAGGVGFSGLGVGGGVAITRVYNDVQAVMAAQSLTTGSAVVTAKAVNGGGDAASATAYAGGAGPVGLGAAWADAYVENDVLASVGGGVNASGAVTVSAEDATSANAESIGAAAGAAAAGVSVAMAEKKSAVAGRIADSAHVDAAQYVSVLADSSGRVHAKSLGATGGLLWAGTGAAANAKDASVVNARVGTDADVYAGEHLQVAATAKPQTRAEAMGVAVGGAGGIGASVAIAEADTRVNATLADDAVAEAERVTVLARALRPDTGQTAYAKAVAGSGSLIFGASAAVATASNNNQVRAIVEDEAVVRSRGQVQVSALNYSEQDAQAVGVTVGGLLAVGANIANATSNAYTESAFNGQLEGQSMVRVYDASAKKYVYVPLAEYQGASDATAPLQVFIWGAEGQEQQLVRLYDANLKRYYYVTLERYNSRHPDPVAIAVDPGSVELDGDAPDADTYSPPVMSFVTQKIDVTALGDDDNFARATSGSGGVVAGAAAAANTNTTSTTKAALHGQGAPGGRTLQAGAVFIDADHTSRFDSAANSLQAAVVGASGAVTKNRVEANVNAAVGEDANIETFDLVIDASGKVRKEGVSGYNTNAASGGVFSGAASDSASTIVQNTQAGIGDDAHVRVVGDRLNPGRLDVQAYNSVFARDRAKLDTGGAIAVARARSNIDVTDSKANVTIGEDAVAHSVGDINLAGRTDMDIRAEANAKTYGLAGEAQGYSDALVNASQNILVKSDADLFSEGNIRLWAGRTTDNLRNDFMVAARTDIWNKTLLPVTSLDARGRLNETATVGIDSGAKLRSVRDIFLYADEGSVGAQGQAIAKDLYRQLANEIAGAMGQAVEEGDLSLHVTKGSGTINGDSSVRVDGLAETGIRNHQYITIDFEDGVMKNVGTAAQPVWVYEEGQEPIHTVTSSEGVTYRIYDESLTQNLAKRLDELKMLLSEYSAQPTLAAVYEAEVTRIETQLRDLGAYVYEITLPGGSKQTVVDADISARFIEVDHILAAPGDIWVEGRRFSGSGELVAPGDATIDVTNNTPYFLRINGLDIPDYKAGRVMFNGSSVADNGAINDLQGAGANFTRFETAATTPDPSITVRNTYNPGSVGANSTYLAPDIRVHGDINNMLGTVALSSAAGSVIADANINGKTLNISAGRDFVLGYNEGFYHAGGDPKGIWADFVEKLSNKSATIGAERYVLNADGKTYNKQTFGATGWITTAVNLPIPDYHATGKTVAGNNIFISARYLNLNGTIQSGIPDWNIDLSGLGSKIATAKTTYQNRLKAGNADPYIEIASFQEGLVKAWWNGELDRIELDGIKVEGGYMELFGEIMNTGGGHLKALDGYGKIDITNTTGYDLVLRDLDVGRGAEGTIKITDLGKTVTRDGKTHHRVTVYKRLGDELLVYDNSTVDEAGNPTNIVQRTVGSRNATYTPNDGLRYSWVQGQNKTAVEKRRWERSSSTFFDLFPLNWLVPDDYENYKKKWTWNVDPRPLLEGDYLGHGQGNAKFSYAFDSKTISVGDWKAVGNGNWCSKRFIGCIRRTYWSEMQKEDGVKDFDIFGVNASNPINIEFIGYDAGHISAKSNAGLMLNGGIYNPTGTTVLDGRTIERLSDSAVIVSKDLQLKASDGIGAHRALKLDVSGLLNATSTRGDIGLDSIGNDLVVDRIGTTGDVRVAALGNLHMADGSGLIQGRRIELTAQGGIGAPGLAVNIDTADNDAGLFIATAGTDIHVKETSGDLRLWQVKANGDVRLETANGGIYDANTNEVRDERAEAELLSLWDDMDLTGADAIASAEAMVDAYVRGKEAEYQQYWQMRNLRQEGGEWVADAYDPNFDFRFDPAEAAQLKLDMGLDDAGLAEIEQQRSDQYHALHTQFGEPLATGYDANYSYVLSATEKADLMEGAVWTENQLRHSIGAGIARGTSDTTVTIEDPNVIGRNVTLIAGGANSTIGRALADDVVIDVNQPLTDAMRLALSTAEKDDIRVEGDLIYVTQRDDVDIELLTGADGLPMGSIEARAGKEIYLGGELDLNIRDVRSPVVHIKAGESIIGSRSDAPVIVADDVVLEAGGGDIGSAVNPLHVAIAGKLARASAAGNVYLTQHDHDLRFDYIYGSGNVGIEVLDGSLLAASGGMFGIDAGALMLSATGDIGTASDMLKVQLTPDSGKGADSGLMVDIGGNLFITSPDTGLALNDSDIGGRALVQTAHGLHFIGDVQSGDDAQYESADDIDLADGVRVASTTGDIAMSGENVSMGAGSQIEAGEAAQIVASGNVSVAQIIAHHANGDAITIDAQGAIVGDGGSDLTATSAGANVALSAGNGIGSGAQALSIEAPNLDASTATGDIDLHLLADTHASRILASDGAINAVADGSLGFGTIQSTGDINLDVVGEAGGTTLQTTAGSLDVQAGSANLVNVDVHGVANIGTAGAQTLGTVTTGGDQVLTAGTALTADILNVGGALHIDAGSADITTADVTNTADLVTSGDQVIGSLTTGDDQTLNAGGDIEFTTLVSGNDLTGTAIGDIRGGSATAAGELMLNAGGDLSVDALTAIGGDMQLVVGGDAQYVSLHGGENLDANVAGHLQGQDADFDGVVAINAGSTDLAHVQTGANADIATTGDLSIDEIIAATTLSVDAGGDATIGTATSTNGQHLHADGLLTAGTLTSQTGGIVIGDALDQTGSANVTTANAATTFTTHTSGGQTLGTVTTGGDQSLNAGGTITAGTLTGDANLGIVAGALILDQGTFEGEATVYTGGDQQIGTLDTEGSITLTTAPGGSGDIVYGHLEAGAPETVGATEERLAAPGITVVADGDLLRLTPTTGDAHAEGMLDMKANTFDVGDLQSAGADVVLEATVDVVADLAHAKRDLKVTAGNDMRIGEVNYGGQMSLFAGRNLWAKVGGDIKFAVAEVGGNADLSSGGEIAFDSLKAGGYVNLDAADDVTIDDFVEAGETITIVSGGDAKIGALTSSVGSISVQATGDVNIDSMTATQGATDASGANVHVNQVASDNGNFDAVDTLHLGTAHIGQRLDLAGRDVVASVFQTKPVDPFVMNLTGHAGGLADVADLHVTSNSEVAFGKVYGKQVDVQTTSDRISVDDAYVPGVLTMETPVAKLIAHNLSVAPVKGVNVQLHEQDHRFRVKQTGIHTDTNAYVLRYSPGYTVSVPNFSENHVDGGPLVRGESALMYAERLGSMALNNATGGNGTSGGDDAPGITGNQTGEDENPFTFPMWPQGLLHLQGIFGPAMLPLTLPADGPAVNIGILGQNGFNELLTNAADPFGGLLLSRMFVIENDEDEEE